jgi:hypothetical protein
LTTFKRENADDVELVAKLQAMTADLKQHMHNAHISKALEVAPACDRFATVKDRIEGIVDDSHMHMSIKTALVRHALRDVGVFTWNGDVEGMIFGYGDPVHGQLVIENMPQSMKDFCMAHEKTLSGIAFDVYSFSRPSASSHASPALKSRKGKPSENVNDYERLLYLIEASPSGYLVSSAVARVYRKCFGCRFECIVDGLQMPFVALIESLKSNPFVKVSVIDHSAYVKSLGTKAAARAVARRGSKRGDDSAYESDEDVPDGEGEEREEGGSDEDPDSSDEDDYDNEDDDSNDDYFFRRGRAAAAAACNPSKIRVVSSRSPPPPGFTSVASASGTAGSGRKVDAGRGGGSSGGGSGRGTPNRKDKRGRARTPSLTSDTDSPGKPGPEVDKVLYKLEWVGERQKGPVPDHPDHVFRNPQYWIFVGHVLHGGRDRGGMWKQLPWGVLKDVILSTKRMKVVDNLAGAFMTPDELKRHGKQAGNSALHVGLQDMLEWMEDMESKSIVASDV